MIWGDQHLVASKVRFLSLHTCSNSCNKKKQVPLHLFTGILNMFMSRVQDFLLLLFSALLISWIGSSLFSLWNFHFQVFSHKFWFWSYFSQLQPTKHSDSIPQILKSFHKLLLRIHSLRNECFLQTRHLKFTFTKSFKTLDNIYWSINNQQGE